MKTLVILSFAAGLAMLSPTGAFALTKVSGLKLSSPQNCVDQTAPFNAPLVNSPYCLIPDYNSSGTLNDNHFECMVGTSRGTFFVGSEVEPHLAVNPKNPNNIVVFFQQDRAARLGGGTGDLLAYSSDGGISFNLAEPLVPFTRCAGAVEGTPGAYDRASDPWLAFDKNGTLYAQGLSFDGLKPSPSGAVVVGRSPSIGTPLVAGIHWDGFSNSAFEIVAKEGNSPYLDKNTMTVDPIRVGPNGDPILYATWSLGTNKSDLFFSRSIDGGINWEARKKIYTIENDLNAFKNSTYCQIAQISVMPDGTLINTFAQFSDFAPTYGVALIRSFDGGETWTKDSVPIALANSSQAIDPELKDKSGQVIPLRDSIGAAGSPFASVNPKAGANGAIYVAFQDAEAPTTGIMRIKVSRSLDNGQTWSQPQIVNQTKLARDSKCNPSTNPSACSAFRPTIHVAANGIVGVSYADLRYDTLGAIGCNKEATNGPGYNNHTCGPLSTNQFLVQLKDDLTKTSNNFTLKKETKLLRNPFDFRKAPLAFGAGGVVPGGLFLGDYDGLADAAGNFLIAFAATNDVCPLVIPEDPNALAFIDCNRNDIYFEKVTIANP